jgi:hypothetical protein
VRYALAAFAVVLSTLLVPIGITATWLSLRVDSTEAYVDTVAPLAEDPELRDALAEEVADAAIATLEENVPMGMLPGAVDRVVQRATKDIVDSDGFPEFWRQANADAHQEFLAIVHDEQDDVVADGYVIVDLRPLLDDVLSDVASEYGIPTNLLPSTPLPLPVIRESRLEQVRSAYQLLDGLSLWAPLLWAGLVVVAVVVAPGVRGRLRAGAACAIGVAIGGVVVTLFTSPVTDLVVDQIEPEKQDLARLVIEVVVDSLDSAALMVAVGGLVVGIVLFAVSLVLGRRAPAGHP